MTSQKFHVCMQDASHVCLPVVFVLFVFGYASAITIGLCTRMYLTERRFIKNNNYNYNKDSGQYVFGARLWSEIFNQPIGRSKIHILSYTILTGFGFILMFVLIFAQSIAAE